MIGSILFKKLRIACCFDSDPDQTNQIQCYCQSGGKGSSNASKKASEAHVEC